MGQAKSLALLFLHLFFFIESDDVSTDHNSDVCEPIHMGNERGEEWRLPNSNIRACSRAQYTCIQTY